MASENTSAVNRDINGWLIDIEINSTGLVGAVCVESERNARLDQFHPLSVEREIASVFDRFWLLIGSQNA